MISSALRDSKIYLPKVKKPLRVNCRHRQEPQACWRARTALLLGLFSFSSALAFASLMGANAANAGYTLPASCRASDNSASEISTLIARVASQPTAASYNSLGQIFAEQGKLPCAVAAYQIALDLDPQLWQTRYVLAIIWLQAGDSSRAVTELRAVVQQKPDSFMAHNALGLALENLADLDDAREEYEKALTLNPRFALGYYNLAHVASLKKRFSAAVFYSQEAVALDPEQPRYQLALGIAYSESGDLEKAIRELKSLVMSHPGFVEAYVDLGAAYGHDKRFSEAVESYRDALRLDPRNSEAQLSLGIALMAASKLDAAVHALKRYVLYKPDDPRGYYWLGRVYNNLGDYQDAVRSLERALSLNAHDYQVHYDLGVALAHLKRYKEAAEQLRAAEKLNPTKADIHYQLIGVLHRLNDKKAESEELAAFQAIKARDAEKVQSVRYYNRGDALLAAGNFKQAAEQYRRALALNPDNPRLHYNLSQALRGLGDYNGQKEELEKAIQLNSNLAPAYYHLARLYMRHGSLEQAEQTLKTALAINPQYGKAQRALALLEETRKHSE